MKQAWAKMGFLALVCCLLFTFPAVAKTTIVHWHNTWTHEGILTYLQEMKVDFEAANPDIEVELLAVSGGEYVDKIITGAATGTGPDIIELWPGPTSTLFEQGLFLDLLPLVERDNVDLARFIPISVEQFTWDGQLWGFPYSGYPVVTFYNHDMFNEAGLVPPAELGEGWTWEAVTEASRLLTRQPAGEGRNSQYGVQVNILDMGRANVFVHQAGGSFVDRLIDPTRSQFNSPEAVEAVRWLNDLFRSEVTSPTLDYQELVRGEVGIVLHTGTYILGHPSFLSDDPGKLVVDVGVARMPKGPVNDGSIWQSDGWMISRSTESAEAAWKWLRHIATNTDHARRFVQLTGRVSSVIEALPSFIELLPDGVINAQAIVEASVDANTIGMAIQSPVRDDINRIFRDNMLNVQEGIESPENALAIIHDQVSALLSTK